jgi:quercetin dioxygenase-like cupin family protein
MSDQGEPVQYFRTSGEFEVDPEDPPRWVNLERDVLGLHVVPGLVLRPVFGKNLTMSFVWMEPNAVAPLHQHPQEQIGTMIEGSYLFELAGEKRWVHKGEVYVVPPNVPHGAETGDEPCLALDVFSPPREAFAELMEEALRAQGEAESIPSSARGNEPRRHPGDRP